jgi:ubiquinone/menaquinone biosynthesis C-methylase UbiE
MLIGKSDDQDTVRMSMRWGKRRLRKKYFRGRKKSLSEQHRKYFNEKAAHWDQMVEDKTLQGLDLIIKGLEIKPGSVVLDVGTGTGILIPFLQEAVGDSGSIVALDLAEEMLKRAKEKHGEQVRYVQGDIVNTPFEDNSFDEMICNSCFPHFQDKEVAVKEMMRILKPGGRVTVCHTASREDMNAMHRSFGGVVGEDMLPDDDEMKSMFQQAGFASIEISDSDRGYLLTARR